MDSHQGGGLVYVAAGWDGGVQDQEGKWDYGWYETSGADVVTRQSYGKQWAHDSALDDNDTIYITVKGPNGGKVDVSGTDTLVIQMGNGAAADQINTHNVFTIALKGGVQSTDDYSWSEICTVDQTVSSTHQFGLSTYYLPLSSFSCSSGSLEALRTGVTEVVVQVIGGKNPEQDTTTSFNHTMPSVGFIGFTNSTAVGSSAPAANVLFASQYAPIAGASAEPFIVTEEGGEVYGFSGGKFTYADYGVTHDGPGVPAAQAYGAIFQHSEAVTEADYFGWTIKGPGNGSVNACGADELVIQLGNAQASTGEFAAANSHMTYTVELKDASGQLCGHDLTLAENTRPGQEGANNFGLQTYYIPMSEFSGCSASAISEVAVKVVGGKDAEASASTEGNATFPVFGFIGFTGDNEEACEVILGPAEPETAALDPADAESDVISLFSDNYSGSTVNVSSFSTDWDEAEVTDFSVGVNGMKKYVMSLAADPPNPFAGIDFSAAGVNATSGGYTHLKMDVWSPDIETLQIRLVDFGGDGWSNGGNDSEGFRYWCFKDIDL